MVLRELAHAGGPTLQVDGHCRSVLTVFAGAACAECAHAECVHIAIGCTAGRWYGWVLRDHGADTRVY